MRSALATLAAATTLAVLAALPACAPAGSEGAVGSASSRLGGTPAVPFGARLDAYRFGIRPNHVSDAQMDAVIKQHYDAWKTNLLVDVPTVPGGKAVHFNQPGYLAVSEGMGYGMLLTVLMAGYDPQAQAIFDGLLRTVRARPAYSIPNDTARPYLMDWRLAGDGSSTDAAGGGWNALDADEDIAMALLMADRQWGSAGTWNYKQEGINTINAMKVWNMKPDGTPMANLRTSRTSDYMIGHFRAYAAATGDGFWNTAVDRTFDLVNRMQTTYSPGVGLVPDFIVDVDTSSPRPSPGGQIESPWEGNYFANGQRDPWRWGTDYVFTGDARWKGVLTKMTDFFVKANGGSPGNPSDYLGTMAVGYHLDGTSMNSEFGNPWPARGLVAGAMNGAQIDAKYQSYVNACWDWLVAKWVPAYYDAELTLLSEIVAAGDWWNPTPSGGGGTTTTAPTTSTMRVQAENARVAGYGVSVKTDLPGFDGAGFVGSFSNGGDSLTATFLGVAAGTGDLHIRYHAWGAQENTVVVNGVTRSESFPATGSGWGDKILSGVSFASGTNEIAIVKDWGYIDVDYLEIAGVASASAPAPSAAASTMHLEAESGATSGSGVGVHVDVGGFTGSGFVGSFTTNGDQLALGFANVPAASYGVRIRYHAWTDQHNDVSVNGAVSDVFFPATGGGWGIVTLPAAALQAGTTNVVVRKNWGYTDIDWVELAP